MIDIFVLCVDRDGVEGRRRRLDELETRFGKRSRFLAVNAWEELETWVLAGLALPKEWVWADVRQEISVKERYFEPLADRLGLAAALGGGRKRLAEEAARNIELIQRKCPEDFGELGSRLRQIRAPGR